MLKNNRLTKVVLTSLGGMVFVTGTAQADDYHYINMLIGERASAMGGAYTAVSDDTAGLFYNPAGIVYSPGSSMSGSMNAYQESTRTYKKVLGGEYDWTRNSESLLPNFFGVVQPFGRGTIGFSYAVPNSINENQDQIFNNISTSLGLVRDYIINFNNDDRTYNFGPSYAMKVTDNLSLGGTLYFHYRQQQRISNNVLSFFGDRVWVNDYYELEEFGVKPIFGLMWSPADQLAIGTTISKVNLLESTITDYQTCLGANGATYSSSSLCQSGDVVTYQKIVSTEEATYPTNVKVGAAWFASDALLVSADLDYNSAHGSGVEERVSVVNFAFGAEYYLSPDWAVRGGMYSDMANTPELKTGVTSYNQYENIDIYGFTGSISHFTRNSSLTLGFSYSTGSGLAQMVSGDASLQDVDFESFGISIGASYSY